MAYDFKNLYIFDMANNHQGDLKHGLDIIRQVSRIVDQHKVKGAIKFQFRNLPDFVQLDHQKSTDNKHVPRFLSTMLSWSDYEVLKNEVCKLGMVSICTPFDEKSVDKIVDMNFDIIKVASCSALDFPLMEKVARAVIPVVVSTGGLLQDQIDNIVSFFDHKATDFALMHCVSIYPTADHECELNNIKNFVERYPGLDIGWSTHESPENNLPGSLGFALGARLFERHVGIPYKGNPLNAYSSTPEQLSAWISEIERARIILGGECRKLAPKVEVDSINSLKRGVYAAKNLKRGENLTLENTYFAFPCSENQLSAFDWKGGIIITDPAVANSGISKELTTIPIDIAENTLKVGIKKTRAMLAIAKITLGHDFEVEYSHHYGRENFLKWGTLLITVINRKYAKKLIVQLPGQSHPAHYHKLKEESFHVLSGELNLTIDGREKNLYPGDVISVLPGVWHSFKSANGCIFEEISTEAMDGDSVYRDPSIALNDSRKTKVSHWGRFFVN